MAWPIPSTTGASICSSTVETFLRDVLDELELPTVDVVANSIGALWPVAFAIEVRPGSCIRARRRSVGLSRRPPLRLLPIGFPLIGRRLGRYVFSNATRDGNRNFWGQLLVEHPERVDDLLLEFRRRALVTELPSSMVGLVTCIADARRLGYRRDLIFGKRWETLTTPTLLVWPDGEAFGSLGDAESVVASNPNLRLVRIEGAGHMAWIDEPERVVAEIERFLGTQPRTGPDAAA